MTTARHALLPTIAVLLVPVTSVALAADLPSPIARHFGPGGAADASGSLLAITVLLTVIGALVAGGSLLAVRSAPDTGTARGLVACAAGLAAGLAGLHLATLSAQTGLEDWTEARLSLATVLLALLVPGAVAAAAGWLLAGDVTVEEVDRTLPAADVAVAPGEAVVWSGRSSAWWAPLAGAGLVLLAAVLHATSGDLVPTLVVVAAAVLVGVSGRARVVVGPSGVRVRGGLLPGFPRVDVPLEEVAGARVERVELMSYGGLGYRVTPGVRAVVTTAGEALRVDREDGPSLVVTLDDARTAAGVLLAHLAVADDAPV